MKRTPRQQAEWDYVWKYFPIEMAFTTVYNYVTIYGAWFAKLAVWHSKRLWTLTRINYYILRRRWWAPV